jgi:hypothetical protein
MPIWEFMMPLYLETHHDQKCLLVFIGAAFNRHTVSGSPVGQADLYGFIKLSLSVINPYRAS